MMQSARALKFTASSGKFVDMGGRGIMSNGAMTGRI